MRWGGTLCELGCCRHARCPGFEAQPESLDWRSGEQKQRRSSDNNGEIGGNPDDERHLLMQKKSQDQGFARRMTDVNRIRKVSRQSLAMHGGSDLEQNRQSKSEHEIQSEVRAGGILPIEGR